MELKWSIRKADQTISDCEISRIDHIKLVYTDTSDATLSFFETWPCALESGTTIFDIPPGTYAFHIEPKCADDRDADTTTPSPVVRDIIEGDVVNLMVQLIVVNDPSGVACAP